jgi:NitT/TauT family transport system substrate-binding protein
MPEVRLAATLGSFGHLPMHLASVLGYFQQEGVKVTVAEMNGSSKVMEALLGGSADVGAGSLEQSIQMAAEGPIQSS